MSQNFAKTNEVKISEIEAGDNNIGNVDIVTLPALPTGTNSIGQVTANAGTNLNTSALALETTNSSIKTAVELIDDAIYTEGAVDSSVTGVPSLMEVSTNTLRPLQGSVAGGLLVDMGANNDVTVTSISAGDNNIGNVDVVTLPALPTGTNSIGQVTANAGTNLNTSALALETTLVDVKAAVESINTWSENVGAPLSGKLISVGGSDGTYARALKVDADGHLKVNILEALPSGTNYIGKTRLTDGTTDAEVIPLTGYNAQAVAIVDSSGDQITSFGGGTQYTEGDTDPTIVGTAMLWEASGDVLATVSENDPLPVNIVAGSSSGTEYTEGDTDASITGIAILMEGAGDTLVPIPGTAAGGLLVNLGSNNDVVVSATNLDIRDLTNADVVTAELSAVDNAVLDAIAASVAAIDTDTTTIIGHVDGIEGLLTTIAGDTTDIEAAIELIDDTVVTMGTDTYTEATSKGLNITAVRRDADTSLADTTNEFSPLITDARGCLKVEAFSGETLPVSLTSTTITGTVAVTQSGTWDEVGINDSGNSITVDAPTGTPVNVQIGNGTLQVGVIDETGASAVDALAVGGGTAHDAVDSGNPLKIGAKAVTALPAAVAANDRANAIADIFGRILVTEIVPEMQLHANKTYTSQQTGTDVIDPSSGKKIAITSVIIGSYGTTAGRVILWFGDNADTTFTQDTDQVLIAASFAPSSTAKPGLVFTPRTPIYCNTADRELHITTDTAISLDITIEYFEY